MSIHGFRSRASHLALAALLALTVLGGSLGFVGAGSAQASAPAPAQTICDDLIGAADEWAGYGFSAMKQGKYYEAVLAFTVAGYFVDAAVANGC